MRHLVFLTLFLSFSLSAGSLKDKTYGTAIVSEVTSIYDADTFRVNISGWPELIGNRIAIRIDKVDTPEIKGKCEAEKIAARLAKQFTVSALRNAKLIELKNMRRGKYFRIIADVFVDGKSIGDALIANKYARLYDGGKRGDWCNN